MQIMQGDTFEELVTNCVTSGDAYRLLYVFIRIGGMDAETKAAVLGEDAANEDAGFVQVLFDAHQPAQHGATFDALRDAADAHSTDWNLVVVTVAKGTDGAPPTDEQAQGYLNNMRNRILEGDVGDFMMLDRDGKAIDIEAETVGEN